jgi:hypothetical protein
MPNQKDGTFTCSSCVFLKEMDYMKLLLSILCALSLAACVSEYPTGVRYGTVEFCEDSINCRYITGNYYYNGDGVMYYYDTAFNAWIGPNGYWLGGLYYSGYYPGLRSYYGDRGVYYHRGYGGGAYREYGGGHGGGHHR